MAKETEAATRGFLSYGGLRPATLLKKGLWHRCFLQCQISKNTFFTEHLSTTAPKESGTGVFCKSVTLLAINDCFSQLVNVSKCAECY